MLEFFRELRIPRSEWDDPALDVGNTPKRMARMLRDELLASYKPGALADLEKRFTLFPSDGQDAMVVEGPLSFSSMCGHHMLPFIGEAFVGYIPGKYVIGASKIPRVVTFYSQMLQIQERLSRQVADFLFHKAEAKLVIVQMRAKHLCMGIRGVKQAHSKMVTTAIRPQPEDPSDEAWRGVLHEFYSQVALLK